MARDITGLLVNHKLIPIPMQSKRFSLKQSCYERSKVIVVTSVYCLLFSTSINKDLTKMDLEKCYQFSLSIEVSLDLKVCFILVTYKDLIALRLTNQVTETSAPYD